MKTKGNGNPDYYTICLSQIKMAEPVDARENDRTYDVYFSAAKKTPDGKPDVIIKGAFFPNTGYLKYSSMVVRDHKTADSLFNYLESVNVTTKSVEGVAWRYGNPSSRPSNTPNSSGKTIRVSSTKIFGIRYWNGKITANIQYPSGIVRDGTYHSVEELLEAIEKYGYVVPAEEKAKIAAITGRQYDDGKNKPAVFRRQIPVSPPASTNPPIGKTVKLGIKDIVSVMNVFECVSKGHRIDEYTAIVGFSNKVNPEPFEKEIRCYRCSQCRRYFMYSTDFENEVLPFLQGDRNYVFTRFKYNGKTYSPPLISDSNGFAQESILKKAGYRVGLNSILSHKERMGILIFLSEVGVPDHRIISYLNSFIKYIGSSASRDMSTANKEWNEDLQDFKMWMRTKQVSSSVRRIKMSDSKSTKNH